MKPGINDYDIFHIEEPITVKCIVNRKKLIGKIVSFSDDPIQVGFNLEFSDGKAFETVACEDDDNKFSVPNKKLQPYIDAMKNALTDFYSVSGDNWYKFEITHDSKEILIWVGGDKDDVDKFSVHFEGDYQFHLHEQNGDWQANTVRVLHPNPINPEIVDLIVGELKKRVS